MGILKEGFSAYSSPVILISRKLTKDKKVVTDFTHLNVRIAKNNLAYPLVRDTFSVLGNSKCEVLSVLDLKDAFHSLRLSENLRKYCGIKLERFKEHLKAPSPIHDHSNITGHSTTLNNFSIVGREEQNLSRLNQRINVHKGQ